MAQIGPDRRRVLHDRVQFTPAEVSIYYAVRCPHLKQVGHGEWRGGCVVHGGKDPNFAAKAATGQGFCHSQCNRGWDMIGLEMALTGATFKEAKKEIYRIVGRAEEPRRLSFRERIEKTYDYTDEHGALIYQVVRLRQPKDFRQRRPDANGGWIWEKAQRQVLYRLPEVIPASIVFVVEGEKDAETLCDYGFVATTNAGGAGAAWLPAYTEVLAGKEVILIPDNDAPGRERVVRIAEALVGKVSRLALIELTGAHDVTDWFEAGHSEVELIARVEETLVSL